MNLSRSFGLIIIVTLSLGLAARIGAASESPLDQFYSETVVVTVEITMPKWTTLLNEQPKSGRCQRYTGSGSRFDWHKADTVVVKTTDPSVQTWPTFSNVGIRKKSFCGSFSTTKPSLRIDLSKYDKTQKSIAEKSFGTHDLTMQNAKQDPLYVRQCLGYRLIEEAGLPTPKCNIAEVFVNGSSQGVYVNLLPFKKPYIKRNFSNAKGNLYELTLGWADFAPGKENDFEYKGYFSDNRADLTTAIKEIGDNKAAGVDQVTVIDEFLRFWAMDILLKHWDGYTQGRNNTFVYNDQPWSSTPRFRFAHWGIDQILQGKKSWRIYNNAVVTKVLAANAKNSIALESYLTALSNTVFSSDNVNQEIFPYIDEMVTQINGVLTKNNKPPLNTNDLEDLKQQISKASIKWRGFKTVFVSSKFYDGNFMKAGNGSTGLAGADNVCNSLAEQADLLGSYTAWLSGSVSAQDRITKSTVPYIRTDGVKVADDFVDLTTCTASSCLQSAIEIDENGGNASGAVWTATNPDGSGLSPNCMDWEQTGTTPALSASTGQSGATGKNWTVNNGSACAPQFPARLYCFQD